MKKLVAGLALAALALSAVGAQAQGIPLQQIQVTPSSYDFGDVPVYAVAQGTLTVKNVGGAPLVVTQVKTKLPFGDNATSFTVMPGKSKNITILFAPQSPGAASGYCTINSNDPSNPLVIIPLSGFGVE